MNWFRLLAMVLAFSAASVPAAVEERGTAIGIVVMHGKGGSPSGWVGGLADELRSKGYLVANLEMPWSGHRDYDVDVQHADDEVTAALNDLRRRGATKVFVAGHSQGGAFALHYGVSCGCDGVIAIAPGGVVSGIGGRVLFADYLEKARQLIAEGKGGDKARFIDHEGTRGTYALFTTPVAYLDWFKPNGAMNLGKSIHAWNPAIPVLWVSPTRDYPSLRDKAEQQFGQLPPNPQHRFYRPDSDHFGAPRAALDEILRWTGAVAAGQVAPAAQAR